MSKKTTRNTKRHKDLMWFGQSTYVHKGDEQSTINMRVQNIETSTNSLGIYERFTQVITYQACDPQILPLTLKDLKTTL